jgi:MFS transporter, Spinster family, sphingosine-1-phosphate transporter
MNAKTPGSAWGLLIALTLLNVLNFADRFLLVSFANSIIADLQLTNFQFTLLTGFIFTVFYALFGLFAGSLADRFHRGRLIAVGLALWSALTAATGLARSFLHAALARVFIGVGEAMLTPAAMSMLSDTLPPHRRALGASIYYLGIPIGIGLSFIFASIAGPLIGWRGSFFLLGGIGLAAALLVLLMRDPPRGHMDPGELSPEAQRIGSFAESAKGMAHALRTTPVLWLTMLGSGAAIYIQGASILDIVWWVQERGYTETRAQQITGVIFLFGGITGALLGGLGADWFFKRYGPGGRLKFLALVYLVMVPIGLAYRLIAPDTALFYTLAFLGSASFMVSYGTTFPTVQEVVPVKLRGASVALLILCNTLIGHAIGAAVAGYLADLFTGYGFEQPLTWALILTVLPGLITIPVFWYASRLQARGS